MRIILVGPGRAGLALATAARDAGHEIVAVVGRDREHAGSCAAALGASPLGATDPIPACDLLVIATRDDDIATVAAALAPRVQGVRGVVHLSGLVSTQALAPFRDAGATTGSFHPLQTLPSPEAGAARIAGAWIAITAADPLRTDLHELASSLGAYAFDLADDAKALYHAGAAAAANFPILALAMAADLFGVVGVPFEAARPLVEAIVANAFEMGPRPSLTGPVARGDVGTVEAQLDAVSRRAPEWLPAFAATVLYLSRLAGRGDDFRHLLEHWRADEDAS